MASIRARPAAQLLRTAATFQRAQSRSISRTVPRLLATDGGSDNASSNASLELQKGMSAPATVPSPNAPDYGAHVDKATSNFTPVPRRLLDGSEEGEVLPAAVLSGAPIELQARTVRIYKPSKPATQSGDWVGSRWRMDWDVLGKGHRWENPLMGWQSSGDAMQGTHLHFKTKEDAIAFAEKQGYEYFVQEPNVRKFVPKAYANNFLYSPVKLKHIRTK